MHFPFDYAWMRAVMLPLCCGVLPGAHPVETRADQRSDHIRPSTASSAINQSLSLDDADRTHERVHAPAATSTKAPPRRRHAVQGAESMETGKTLVLPPRGGSRRSSTEQPEVATPKIMDVTSLGALAIVLVLLGVVVYGLRRFVPAFRTGDHDALRVVARAGLSPKHSLALIRLGRRYVLVGMAGDRVNALCEVTDPQEVAELTAHVGSTAPAGHTFDRLLSHELKDYRSERQPVHAGRSQEDVGSAPGPCDATAGFVSLCSRLRSLKAG